MTSKKAQDRLWIKMTGKRPDYRVYVTFEVDIGNVKWMEIGVAFVNNKDQENESIVVKLNALPVNGKLVLLKPKYEEKEDVQNELKQVA